MRIFIAALCFTFFNISCALLSKYDADDLKEQYPAVYGLIEEDKSAIKVMTYYAGTVIKEKRIKNFKKLKRIYDYRDSFVVTFIEDNLEKQQLYYERLHNKLAIELDQLGVKIISAEGIYIDVGPALVLKNKLKELAPKDYQLYQKFIHYNTLSKGSEYPFLDMQAEQELILIGEKFIEDSSLYWHKIKEDFFSALITFYDMHKVIDRNDVNYIAGNTYVAHWPFATQLEERQQFITTNPDSRFNSSLQQIIKNISSIDVNESSLYLIVTDWNDDYETGKINRQNYLLNKKDIPHLLEIRRKNNKILYANVYRFYSNKKSAETILEHIKKGHPDSEIIKVKQPGDVVLEEIN